MPAIGAPPGEVIEIDTVSFVGAAFVQLSGGRMYAKVDGICMGSAARNCIEPAMDEHRAALNSKRR
jgi:hypothetical protein